jgi:hypothetical protein
MRREMQRHFYVWVKAKRKAEIAEKTKAFFGLGKTRERRRKGFGFPLRCRRHIFKSGCTTSAVGKLFRKELNDAVS